MWRKTFKVFLALFVCLAVSGCRDAHDRVMDDQLDWMEEIAGVFEQVADEEMTADEATKAVEQLVVQGNDLRKRKQDLSSELTDIRAEKLMEDYTPPVTEALGDIMHALNRARSSGRLSRELQDTIQELKLVE